MKYVPKFITPKGASMTVPYTGLSMREIYSRFVNTGVDVSLHRQGYYREDPENAISSEADPDDKFVAHNFVVEQEQEPVVNEEVAEASSEN